jgi:hypothetical protein
MCEQEVGDSSPLHENPRVCCSGAITDRSPVRVERSSVERARGGSYALAAGTALVGDFSKAVLYDRRSLAITLGTISDPSSEI